MDRRLVIGGLALLVAGVLLGAQPGAALSEPSDLIANGGFEAAFDSWTIVDQEGGSGTWCAQSGTLAPGVACDGVEGTGATVEAPPEGSTAAMTDQNGPGSHVLSQCVTLPGTVASATLSFQLYLNTQVEAFVTGPDLDYSVAENQQFRGDVVSEGGLGADPFTVAPGDILLNVYQTDPGDPLVSGYDLVSADVSSLAGETVCVRFAEVDNLGFFNAGVDDVRLEVEEPAAPPSEPGPEASITLTPSAESVTPGGEVDVTATVLDENGNPVEGVECSFRVFTQPGTGASVDPAEATTDAAGKATTTLQAGSTLGAVEVLAECGIFAKVLEITVGPTLPETGAATSSGGMQGWLIAFLAGVAAMATAGYAALRRARRA